MMTLSLATLNRCAELWASQTISPTADDFENVAAMLGQGRRELIDAIVEATAEADPMVTHPNGNVTGAGWSVEEDDRGNVIAQSGPGSR